MLPTKRERSESPDLLPSPDPLRRSITPPMPRHLYKPSPSSPPKNDNHAADRMASVLMDEMLRAEDVLDAQLHNDVLQDSLSTPTLPTPTPTLPTLTLPTLTLPTPTLPTPTLPTALPDTSALFKTLAAANRFIPWEQLLFAACECTFSNTDTDLHRIAQAITDSRITEERITAHAREIGVETDLRIPMVRNVRAFAHFMYTVEKLDIIKLQEPMQHRSLLGYASIRVLHQKHWETVIAFACDQGCFGARSSIYEMLLRFGYGAAIGPKPRKNNNPGNSTEKKNDVLLHTSPLVFSKDRLASNLKRYTNGQIKPKQNPLLVLANMAQQSSTSV